MRQKTPAYREFGMSESSVYPAVRPDAKHRRIRIIRCEIREISRMFSDDTGNIAIKLERIDF
jgi:hypothetical protein